MKWLSGWRVAFMLGLATLGIASPACAAPPTVVLSLKSVDELLDHVDFLADAAGQEGVKGIAEVVIGSVTDGEGLAGIDRSKPFGGYWTINQAKPDDMGTFVVFLPVSDAAAMKKLVKKLAPDFKEAGGQMTFSAQGTPLFAKINGGYCYVSSTQDGLKDLADPKKILVDAYDVALDINLANIPDQLKNIAIEQFEKGARDSAENQPKADSEAEEQLQKSLLEKVIGINKALVTEGDRVTLGFVTDTEAKTHSIDFNLSGKANSGLAKALAVFGRTKPAYAAVPTDSAALSMMLSFPTTGILDVADDAFAVIRHTMNEEIEKDEHLKDDADKKAAKDVGNRLVNLIEATVKSGSVHSVVVMDEGTDDTVRLVAGHNVAKGEDAGKLLDDLLALEKENEEVAKITVDVAKHAGARIHSIAPDLEDKHSEMFGDGPGHLAIRPDSIWLSIGGGNLESLKSALDQSGKKPSKPVAPISLRAKPAEIIKLTETEDQGLVERAEGVAGEPGDLLVLEVAPTDKGGIKLHLEFGVSLFKLGAK